MTTLDKIGIQGIRSYCDEYAQQLEFSSPITIIYGNNGSGKSTIIECLKVNCTGDFPPNAEKGKSFIHDPLISNKMNVRGKIDLLLKNYNNKKIGISRSFSLYYSKDKQNRIKHTFRSLDNNIIIKKDKGDDIIITNKCVDINCHIPKLMGVSKALLENVILCHHDESLWPFSESTKIKKKFDELFGDDNFSKILEELVKCKKKMNEVLKKKNYELINIKDSYEKKKNIFLEIEKNQAEIENEKIFIQQEKEELKKKTVLLDQFKNKNNILYKISSDIDTYFVLYERHQSDIEQYKDMKEIYEESSSELEKFSDLFKTDLAKCNELIEKINDEIKKLEEESENCLNAYACGNLKECSEISDSIFCLEKKEKQLLDMVKKIYDLDICISNNFKNKHVKNILLKEHKKITLLAQTSYHTLNLIETVEGPTSTDELMSSSDWNGVSVLGKDGSGSNRKCITNRGRMIKKVDLTFLKDLDLKSYQSVVEEYKEFEKRHKKRIKKIYNFIRQKKIQSRENRMAKNKNKNTLNIKKYQEKLIKIDKKIDRIEKYKKQLILLKSNDNIYDKQFKNLEKMIQLKNIYDTIISNQFDDCNLSNDNNICTYKEQNEKNLKKEKLNEIVNLKSTLNKVLDYITNVNLLCEYFYGFEKIRKKIIFFFNRLFFYYTKIQTFLKLCNGIKKKQALYDCMTKLGILNYEDNVFGFSLANDNSQNSIFISKIDEGRETDKVYIPMMYNNLNVKKEEDNWYNFEEKNVKLENKIEKNTKLKSLISLENPLENISDCVNKNEDMSSGKFSKLESKKRVTTHFEEAECGMKKKQRQRQDKLGTPQKMKMIESGEANGIDYEVTGEWSRDMETTERVLRECAEKYENKIEQFSVEIKKVQDKIMARSNETIEADKEMKNYLENIKTFNEMLEKLEISSISNFLNIFYQTVKNIKEAKRNINWLVRKREEANANIDRMGITNFCNICNHNLEENEMNQIKTNINNEMNKIDNEIEEEKKKLDNLKKNKKTYLPLLKYYYNYIQPINNKVNNLSENKINEIKNEIANLQESLNTYLNKINKTNEKYKTLQTILNISPDLINLKKQIVKHGKNLFLCKDKIKSVIDFFKDNTNTFMEKNEFYNLSENFIKQIEKTHDEDNPKEITIFVTKLKEFFEMSMKIIDKKDEFTYAVNIIEKDYNHILCSFSMKNEFLFCNSDDNAYTKDSSFFFSKFVKFVTAEVENEMREEIDQGEVDRSVGAPGGSDKFNDVEDVESDLNSFGTLSSNDERDGIVGKLEDVEKQNKTIEKLYTELIVHINKEEIKTEEEIHMVSKMEFLINDKKIYVNKKIKELEDFISKENKIKECIKKTDIFLSYYLEKKKEIDTFINFNYVLIKKYNKKNKDIKKKIINNKYGILFENKNFFLKSSIINTIGNNLKLTKREKEKQEFNLKNIREQISNNELIKNESNEIINKIKKKKEQMLCLKEEKINIEKMHHNVVMNTNLKKIHELFLKQQGQFLGSLSEFRENIVRRKREVDIIEDEINNSENVDMGIKQKIETEKSMIQNQVNEIEFIIKTFQMNHQSNIDIHKFLRDTFDHPMYKRKLEKIINTEKEILKSKIEECKKCITDIQIKEGELQGKICLRNEYVEKLKKDIKSGSYENIDNEYKKKLIEICVYKNVIKDLSNFHNSFDQAIIKFHSLKMQEINLSIKNLWRRVYNNPDIDYIYIKSDLEIENNEKINQRRSYNYRVVMVKDNCELDMKGRCSSGQKVLSSIIIRLALAESFSIKCGILALDEPTTNLDKSNSKNLANLIANIVDLRKNSSSFQLILITHDTYFVDALSQYGLTNCFYKVRKDKNGYSQIVKVEK
ncbi:DNA repair protein RAD50, putative [Plasmodium chabaudi chabaudi]|uniref:DNA repair protein RAD50, putative n=1 Tax=Plasmodium chabaudi chabaudi TaxID=31271 RepID=A0A4V0JZR9_PLACU|nr:DNA repair protein RAD50, putative [Plasmodium chabaudi chabaudi]VTZ66232.1 DNA repair protein RAD50, putative [Plasmodium chabaudi chabaudi]|eukprot:XP_016652980.1 DNA repair protein RAD50, putative [Plasmodium chabaudi chabaudi]